MKLSEDGNDWKSTAPLLHCHCPSVGFFIFFLKPHLYFLIYYILLIMVLQLSPLPLLSFPLPSTPHSLSNPHTIVHVHGSCVCALWLLLFLCGTLHLHGYSVTTYLYFLIPSPPHPFPHISFPSGNHQNNLCVHDSVSILVCFACFLDSIVDRFVLIAILLFTVLIYLFLNKSF